MWLNSDGEEGPRLSYAELDRQATQIATALRRIAEPGDRAVLLYLPGLEFIPAFFGCQYAGLIAVPAYPPRLDRPWQSDDSLTRLVDDCRPRVILTGGEEAAAIERACRNSESLSRLTWINTSLLADAAGSYWSNEAENSTAISHLQYTSGSTGTPKGVMISHGNLMHNQHLIAVASGHYESAAAGICGVNWLPFQHDFGLIAGLLQAVFVGGPLVLLSPLTMLQRPWIWLEALSRYRGHTSAGPNFAFDLCVQRVDRDQVRQLDLRSWKIAGIGAEPIRAATLDRFADHFASAGFRRETFYPSYGLAEATLYVTGGDRNAPPVLATVSAAALEDSLATDASPSAETGVTRTFVGCGCRARDQQLVLVDPRTGLPASDGRVGEICVAGPSVAHGYWNRPAESQQVFQAQFPKWPGSQPMLRTGDLGFLRNEELFVTGRLKDLLIVRGQNHYPQDVEQTVQGVDSAFLGAAGAAFQIETDDEPRLIIVQEVGRRRVADPVALSRSVRRTVADRHGINPDEVVFVRRGTLPKTTSGKIQRFACRHAYESNRLSRWTSPDAANR